MLADVDVYLDELMASPDLVAATPEVDECVGLHCDAVGSGSLGILAVAVVIAVGATIAIDCATHDECIWTTVNNAGGWGVVLGTAPNPNAAPSGMVTVSCFDPTPRITQCKNSSLKNVITNYYSWFGGSYWTCGDLGADEAAGNISSSQVAALNQCNAQANQLAKQRLGLGDATRRGG